MKPVEIHQVVHQTMKRCGTGAHEAQPVDDALLSLHNLVKSFLHATEACGDMRSMSIDQVRILNQLHLAVAP